MTPMVAQYASGVSRSRTLMLIFGVGAATGLHFGLLHLFLWRNWAAPPLVENAVKHGLSRKIGPGRVRIEARTAGDVLTLSVHDDGVGMSEAILGHIYERGVGLRNLRDRLQQIYGPTHAPAIVSRPGEGTRVELTLPAHLPRAA